MGFSWKETKLGIKGMKKDKGREEMGRDEDKKEIILH
jgi:hypothetical protein